MYVSGIPMLEQQHDEKYGHDTRWVHTFVLPTTLEVCVLLRAAGFMFDATPDNLYVVRARMYAAGLCLILLPTTAVLHKLMRRLGPTLLLSSLRSILHRVSLHLALVLTRKKSCADLACD